MTVGIMTGSFLAGLLRYAANATARRLGVNSRLRRQRSAERGSERARSEHAVDLAMRPAYLRFQDGVVDAAQQRAPACRCRRCARGVRVVVENVRGGENVRVGHGQQLQSVVIQGASSSFFLLLRS